MKGMPVELLTLRYFQAVARHEHISRAAAELRVAQPAVSRTIQRLESELGVPLFDRQGRRVRLNRFGAAFLRRVDRALDELADARQELTDAAGLEYGSIALAAETLRPLTGMIHGFLTEHPQVDLRLFESDLDTMTRQLREGEVDLCFASQPLTSPTLHTVELLREEVLLAVPPDHQLAGRGHVDVAALAGQPLITTRPGHWLRTLTERLFASAQVTPQLTCECNEPTVMLELISAGLGIGLGPSIALHAEPRPSVAWLQLDASDCHRSLSVVWHEDTYLSVAAGRLRDYAQHHFARTLPA